MPLDLKIINIDAKDEAAKQEILDAFAAMYANPLDGQGQPAYTPDQLVRRHIKNFIRGVVAQARQKVKIAEVTAAGEVNESAIF